MSNRISIKEQKINKGENIRIMNESDEKIEIDVNGKKIEIKKGDIINAKDCDGVWYDAKIIKVYKKLNSIKIRYFGWSSDWNKTLLCDKDNIAPRYNHVPDWIKFLNVNDNIELADSKLRWNNGIIKSVNGNNLTIMMVSKDKMIEVEVDKNSPLIALPFTHNGFNRGGDILEQRKNFLQISRDIAQKKYDIEQKKEYKLGIARYISKYFNNEELSDIKFLFEGDKYIYGHKIIIFKSEWFKKLVNWSNNNKLSEIKIEKCRYTTFFEILRFLYCGELNLDVENCSDIFITSNLYLLYDINKIVYNWIKKNINEKNINEDDLDLEYIESILLTKLI